MVDWRGGDVWKTCTGKSKHRPPNSLGMLANIPKEVGGGGGKICDLELNYTLFRQKKSCHESLFVNVIVIV